VDEIFHNAERPAVEHFAGGRSDGAGGDVNDGFRGIVHRIKYGKKGFDGFGLAGELYCDFGNQGKSAFGADEEASQVVTGRVSLRVANTNDFAVGKNEFECGDVIGGDAVSERVGTARVFGHVAADGAGFLAGGIGREIEAVRFRSQCEVEIDDAWLDDGALIFRVDGKDAVHARENEHQTAGAGERATGKAGTGATSDDGHVVFGGEFDDL